MKVRIVHIIIGVASTLFFLALALYRVQLGSVGTTLAHANPTWIGAAVVAYAANLSLARCDGRSYCALLRQYRIQLSQAHFSSGMDSTRSYRPDSASFFGPSFARKVLAYPVCGP
jgi:hypothetical protein